MDIPQSKKLIIEAIWWLITAVIIALVLIPIYNAVPDYPFWGINIIAIAVFITATRYIFLLKYTPISRWQFVKAAIVILSVPLIFNLVNNINYFQTYIDEQGILSFLGHLHPDRLDALEKYIRAEMILFGVGSVVASVILPIRLIRSIWKVRNKDEV